MCARGCKYLFITIYIPKLLARNDAISDHRPSFTANLFSLSVCRRNKTAQINNNKVLGWNRLEEQPSELFHE